MSATTPYTSSSIYLSVAGLAEGARLSDLPEDITAGRHAAPERIGIQVCVGPRHNDADVSFNGSRADLLVLLERMRAALDAVPSHPADQLVGGEAS
jgi:hypothetical protein